MLCEVNAVRSAVLCDAVSVQFKGELPIAGDHQGREGLIYSGVGAVAVGAKLAY